MTGLIEARASTIAISSTIASSLPVITSRVTASAGCRSAADVEREGSAVIFFRLVDDNRRCKVRRLYLSYPRMAAKPMPLLDGIAERRKRPIVVDCRRGNFCTLRGE